jgi:hypothetical protein
MNKNLSIVVGIVITLLVAPTLWYAVSSYQANVFGNKSEVAISAEYRNGKNILGQFTAKLAELAQVRTMSVEDQERLIQAVFGKDGRAGSKAAMQWIKEQNPKPDLTIVKKIASIIDSSRNKFMNHQTSILARCQQYETALGHPLDGYFLEGAGYPNKKLKDGLTIEKMCTPLESSYSKEAFETGIDNGFQFK